MSFKKTRRTQGLAVLTALSAGLLAAALVGLASARSFAVRVASNATVQSAGHPPIHEAIVVTPRGRAIYTLSGDSRRHPECTQQNSCLKFWPPVAVRSAHHLSAPRGLHGRLGTWRRDGFIQLTLGGHPLYTFALDKHRDIATGEGVTSFGGTWHVVSAGRKSAPGGSTSTMTTTTPSTTTTTPYPY